jgi:hypothetical protein
VSPFRVGKGEVELDDGRPFPLRVGFTPIIDLSAQMSTTFGWVEGGGCSLAGSVCPGNRTGGWGDGDLDLDDRIGTGDRCWGPGLEGDGSVAGGGSGRSRLECGRLAWGDVGGPGLEDTPEYFRRSGSVASWDISVLDVGTCCLSSLTIAAVTLTRFGFLARSLVG